MNPQNAKDEKVYSAADVRELIEQNKTLVADLTLLKNTLSSGEKRTPVAKEIKERTCTIMFIDDQPVIGLKNKGTDKRPVYLYDKQDPNRRNEYFLYADIIVKDGDKTRTITMDWNEFLEHADRADCKIVKAEKKQWVIEQGTTMRRVIDSEYKIEIDSPVDMNVEGFSQMLLVQLPNGEQVELDADYVNMSK